MTTPDQRQRRTDLLQSLLDLPPPPTPAEIAWTIAKLVANEPPTPRALDVAMWLVGWDSVPDTGEATS
jgi:hypothetical protein